MAADLLGSGRGLLGSAPATGSTPAFGCTRRGGGGNARTSGSFGAGAAGKPFHFFIGIDHRVASEYHFMQRGNQNARIGGKVMDHVNAAAGERVKGCRLALVQRFGEILEQILAGIALVQNGRVQEVEHNNRNALVRRLARQGIAEFAGLGGTREAMCAAGNLLERGNFLLDAVFQHLEVFPLKSGDVMAGLVGYQGGNQHHLGASGEFDFRTFLFFLGFCEEIDGTSQSGDDCETAGKLTADPHFRAPFRWSGRGLIGNPRLVVRFRIQSMLPRTIPSTLAEAACRGFISQYNLSHELPSNSDAADAP